MSSATYRLISGAKKGDERYHLMKFHSSKPIDPVKEMIHPIRLHRRMPVSNEVNADEMVDDKPDMSVVAPYGGGQFSKRGNTAKKTRQVIHEDVERAKLIEEESIPWVLEDFDGENTWVGSLEGGKPSGYAFFMFTEDGFRVVPADKWYTFTKQNKFKTLTLDEAEEKLNKNQRIGRWVMKSHETPSEAPVSKMRTVVGGNANRSVKRELEGDELDYDEDFADDEGAPIIEGHEEDNKDVEMKMKREMMYANKITEDNEVDDLFNEGENRMNKEGRKVKKYLRDLEKNLAYESDEEENPYLSSESDSGTTSDAATKTEPKVGKQAGFEFGSALKRDGQAVPQQVTTLAQKQIVSISKLARPDHPDRPCLLVRIKLSSKILVEIKPKRQVSSAKLKMKSYK